MDRTKGLYSNSICANYYGFSTPLENFCNFDGLLRVAEITYCYVHFQQGFSYYMVWHAFVKWQRISDNKFKTHLKSDSSQSTHVSLLVKLLLSMPGKPVDIANQMGSFMGLIDVLTVL